MRRLFVTSVVVAAMSFAGQSAAQQATKEPQTVEDLHKMFLEQQQEITELKAERYDSLIEQHSEMREHAAAAENEAKKAQQELAETREELEQVRVRLDGKTLSKSGWVGKFRWIHFFDGETGVDPAFGRLSDVPLFPPRSNNISSSAPSVDGDGIRLSAAKFNTDHWFYGADFEAHRVSYGQSIGQPLADANNVHANLLNRSLADSTGLNRNVDDGVVDYARDKIELDQYSVDLVFGRRIHFKQGFSGFWKAGLRGASSDMERGVDYLNYERPPMAPPPGGTDWVRIDFENEMYGAGPLIGAGASLNLPKGFVLSGETCVSAVYSQFKLDRDELHYSRSLDRFGYMNIDTDTSGLVPMLDVSVEVSKALRENLSFAVGYSLSAWKDGSRTISIYGWDDIDDATPPYTVDSGDIILHGLYASACYRF